MCVGIDCDDVSPIHVRVFTFLRRKVRRETRDNMRRPPSWRAALGGPTILRAFPPIMDLRIHYQKTNHSKGKSSFNTNSDVQTQSVWILQEKIFSFSVTMKTYYRKPVRAIRTHLSFLNQYHECLDCKKWVSNIWNEQGHYINGCITLFSAINT